jgi:undecaprenyl phosphate N,N'-diacetylbacillosamine 1-phosphate transferase
MYRLFFKRFFDLILSLTLLVLSSPVFLGLYVFLTIYYKGSPIFYQERPGYKGRRFNVLKFRSMIDAFDENGKPLPDIERITPVGMFLRKTSLDELPQLVNVFRGDMSFIGPRPLLTQYLPYYTNREMTRHMVRPGITGLAQVNGRNFLNWKDRLELDARYVEDLSFRMDLNILVLTIIKVFRGSDIKVVPDGTPFDEYRQAEQEAQHNQQSRLTPSIK